MNSHSNTLTKIIIDDENFSWSFSRIKKYDDCKYSWYIKYIEEYEEEDMFFSQYGSFIHELYCMLLSKEITPSEMKEIYVSNFKNKVFARAPTEKIFVKYFEDGVRATSESEKFLSYINDNYNIVGTEIGVDFKINNNRFVGFIDLLLKDNKGNFIIVDHKSRSLKPYSNRRIPTKSDILLDEYYKQLYVYSEAVRQMYGKYPTELWFNCFRNEENNIIKEQFYSKKLSDVLDWVNDSINNISNTTEWSPTVDPFFCSHLCGCNRECEYYDMLKGNYREE